MNATAASTVGRERTAAMLRSLRLLLITGWCGMTWTIGYVVAPTLFRMLDDRMLAGSLAGALFRLQGWTSVGVALLLLWMTVAVGMRGRVIWRDPDVRIVLGMLLCTLIGYFALQPLMQGLKELMAVHGPAVPDEIRQRFGIVHGVSATFYLAHSMLGLWLVLRQAGWPAQP